jgi:glutathione S-transferase
MGILRATNYCTSMIWPLLSTITDTSLPSLNDLMMVSVLLRPRMSGMLDEYPNLSAYVARGEARPAYKRAFEAQLAVYKPPAG